MAGGNANAPAVKMGMASADASSAMQAQLQAPHGNKVPPKHRVTMAVDIGHFEGRVVDLMRYQRGIHRHAV